MARRFTGETVFDSSINRMVELMEQGHRCVVSFSGGKDSCITLEIALIAATITGKLPLDVIMRDEEIMFPGTFEYCERVAARPEVSFNWIYCNQPIPNIFNRENPYWWVFDPLLPPEKWVRQPPSFAYLLPTLHIDSMTIPERFPTDPGKELFAVIGLRGQESRTRMMSIHSAKSHLTKPNKYGTRNCRPIYDWTDGDVWKAISDNHWDYNEAYDVMSRLGVSRNHLRIAPPTMTEYGADFLGMAARAWPGWFETVCNRLDGVRLAAKYGRRAVKPMRHLNETWEQCFYRVCVNDAPEWIKERSLWFIERKLKWHAKHSTEPLPDVANCPRCEGKTRSWKMLTDALYLGDPFALHVDKLPYMEPDFFRPGSGKWGGKPTF